MPSSFSPGLALRLRATSLPLAVPLAPVASMVEGGVLDVGVFSSLSMSKEQTGLTADPQRYKQAHRQADKHVVFHAIMLHANRFWTG